MNIYIKSFNRPFYLERCIQSIKFNVSGDFRIVVLDDGTQKKYLDELKRRHPDILFRHSGADDDKYELVRLKKYDLVRQRYIEPSRFWMNEIEREESSYFILLEDDTWFVEQLNVDQLQNLLDRYHPLIVKFFWGSKQLAGDDKVTKRTFLDDRVQIDFFWPRIRDRSVDPYKIWIVCMAVYEKKYWLDCFRNIKDMTDEATQLAVAYETFRRNRNRYAYAKTKKRFIYQGWIVPGRSDPLYEEYGLDSQLYIDALNSLWLSGELVPLENYPYDFSERYIVSNLHSFLKQEEIEKWKKWIRGDLFPHNRYYYND